MKPNGILWDPWDVNNEILSHLIMPKIHEPKNLIQSIPIKDAIGNGSMVLMMPMFSITTIMAKDHANAQVLIGLIQEMKNMFLWCFFPLDGDGSWWKI